MRSFVAAGLTELEKTFIRTHVASLQTIVEARPTHMSAVVGQCGRALAASPRAQFNSLAQEMPPWLLAQAAICGDCIALRLCSLLRQQFEGCFLAVLFVVIVGFETTFNRISNSTRSYDRCEGHPSFLILTECFVERLPGVREFLEVGRTLTQ